MFYLYISLSQNQAPYLAPFFILHTTLNTVFCPDRDFNPCLTSGCLTSSPNALFPQPKSAHVSTSFAHISFLKHKPAYLISGYLSALLLFLSFLYEVPKVLFPLFIATHTVTSCQCLKYCQSTASPNMCVTQPVRHPE